MIPMKLRFSLRSLLLIAPLLAVVIAAVFRPPSAIEQLQSVGIEVVPHDQLWFDMIGNIMVTRSDGSEEVVEDPAAAGGVFYPPQTRVTVDMVRDLHQLETLKVVGLHGCTLEPGVLQQVARCDSVELVGLTNSNAADEELLALTAIPALKCVDIHRSQITAKGIAKFYQQRPDVTLWNWYN